MYFAYGASPFAVHYSAGRVYSRICGTSESVFIVY